MAEFDIPLLTKVLLLESRTFEFVDNTKAQSQLALLRLTYTRYSWRLIGLMFKLSPRNTIIIIMGRFLEGIIPSIDLRIKGQFLDIVRTRLALLTYRYKPHWRKSLSADLDCINLVLFKFSCTFSPLHLRITCMFLGGCTY